MKCKIHTYLDSHRSCQVGGEDLRTLAPLSSLPLGAFAAPPLDEIWKMGCLGGVPNELEDNEKEGNCNEFRKESYLLPLLSLRSYRRIGI